MVMDAQTAANALVEVLTATIAIGIFVGMMWIRSWKAYQQAKRTLAEFHAETDNTVFVLGDDGEIKQVKRKNQEDA